MSQIKCQDVIQIYGSKVPYLVLSKRRSEFEDPKHCIRVDLLKNNKIIENFLLYPTWNDGEYKSYFCNWDLKRFYGEDFEL